MTERDNLMELSKDELVNLVLKYQRDSLTNVYKREYLDTIDEENYIVAMIDINGLKNVNDTLGHEAGDEYIKETVKSIKHVIRKDDIIIRYGGDEFLVLFKNVLKNQAEEAIKRIKNASCGIAEHKDINLAIKIADQEMYKNKIKYYANMKEL